MAEIVCYIFVFHLTWPMSLHYLVKRRCSNFYLTLDLLQSDCSDLMSKWRGHTVAKTFLLRCHCQTRACCPETIFLCFNRTAPWCISTQPSLSCRSEREIRETRRRLSACVCVRCIYMYKQNINRYTVKWNSHRLPNIFSSCAPDIA